MATYVLVHGSYQGGWIWKDVANRLRAAGHEVYAPSLDGCAERKDAVRPGITTETQADEIAQLLFYEDLHNVVLVGTSSGGMVVCRVAEKMRDRIKRLVFVDALALLPGEKIRDIVTSSTSTPSGDGLTAGPSREDAANRLFADLDPKMRDWALQRYTQHPIGIYNEPVKLDSFWQQQWPGTLVVWCRRAQNPGEAHQRRAAERLGAKWEELDTGHYPMLSMPGELTRLLLAG
jgi:pimeloyl-ACP methyl ester carboxylesterase